MQFKVFFKAYPETTRCPSCSKIGRIRRSRSHNIFESLIKATRFWGYYKCRECGWRGILSKYAINRFSFVTIGFYLILIFLITFIILKILNKNFGGG